MGSVVVRDSKNNQKASETDDLEESRNRKYFKILNL